MIVEKSKEFEKFEKAVDSWFSGQGNYEEVTIRHKLWKKKRNKERKNWNKIRREMK